MNKDNNETNDFYDFWKNNDTSTDIHSQSGEDPRNIANDVNKKEYDNNKNILNEENGKLMNNEDIHISSIDPSKKLNTSVRIFDDELLLKKYVGSNYDKIKKRKFSIGAFLFTNWSFYYHTMIICGIVMFLIKLFLFILLKYSFPSLIFETICGIFIYSMWSIPNILIRIVYGFGFDKFYIWYAKKKIKNIIKNNPDKSAEQLEEICSSKGGTSTVQLIIGIIIQIIIGLIIVFTLLKTEVLGNWYNDPNLQKNTSNEKDASNSGLKLDDSINISDKYEIQIPEVFEDLSDSYKYWYTYSDESESNSCSFQFYKNNQYIPASEISQREYKDNIDYNATPVKKMVINNITWYEVSYDSLAWKYYMYFTEKEKDTYTFQFSIESGQQCLTYKDEILNSMRAK